MGHIGSVTLGSARGISISGLGISPNQKRSREFMTCLSFTALFSSASLFWYSLAHIRAALSGLLLWLLKERTGLEWVSFDASLCVRNINLIANNKRRRAAIRALLIYKYSPSRLWGWFLRAMDFTAEHLRKRRQIIILGSEHIIHVLFW